MRGDVLEVREPVSIARHAVAVVFDGQVVLMVFTAPRNRNGLRMRVDAVLDELRNRFERVTLGQRDDPDRVPVIPDLEFAAVVTLGFHAGLWQNSGSSRTAHGRF